ncbi:MAG: DUF5916 domain-containing protein [Vicinamibacteria bacterium]
MKRVRGGLVGDRILALNSALLWGHLVASVTHAAPQETTQVETAIRSAVVTATTESITIDGVLDEPIWSAAPKIGDLIQRQPVPGETPTEGTDVTLLYDENNLYIGVVAYDSEPQRVIGTQMARDASLNSDDRIELLLDTFRDQRNAFYFATNPSGALVDGLTFANGELNTDWDAIWHVRTKRTEQGWVAEFAIPFKSLNFPAGRTVWGFNFSRNIYRKLEDTRWSGARLETQFLQVSEAGEITNLDGMTQGIGLDLRPFVAGNVLHLSETGEDDFDGKPGLDLFYSITPSLKLTGTFNTDFGETEVDARQINLQRFSLFFPEKRAFFLEDAGVFSFASTGPGTPGGIPSAGADVYPFFSRRIGLLDGEEVPLDAGGKLTGKVGRTDVGVLAVRSGDLEDVVEEKNLFVGRIKQNLFQQSYVGLIFTGGDPASGESGETYGADLRLTTSRFLGESRNLDVNAYAVRSANEGVSDRDWSYGFSARYPNDKFDAQFVFREIQDNFDPALGFVQRDNVQLLRIAGSYNPRPRDFLNIQQMFHDVFYTRFTRLDNNLVESWDLFVTLLDWHFNSGDSIHGLLDLNPTYERLFEPFEISPGVVLPPGEYRFTRFKTSPFSTATKRRLSGSLTFRWGNYWSGEAEQLQASVTYKLPPKFTVSFSTNQTFARLPEGDFTASIVTSNIDYSASPRLSFFNLIQYDNRSRNLGWQSRVRWTLQPGNELFVSFHQGWIQEEGDNLRFRAQDSKMSAKFQYTFRF